MLSQQGVKVNITHPVTIGQHEPLVPYVLLHPFFDAYNAIGYGYQWWVPEGNAGEFMAIGVYGQWIYVNPTNRVIIVKTSADPDFMEKGYELKHVEFFRAIAAAV